MRRHQHLNLHVGVTTTGTPVGMNPVGSTDTLVENSAARPSTSSSNVVDIIARLKIGCPIPAVADAATDASPIPAVADAAADASPVLIVADAAADASPVLIELCLHIGDRFSCARKMGTGFLVHVKIYKNVR